MAGWPIFPNFWRSLASPLRTTEGTRRDPGIQLLGPFQYKYDSAVEVNEDTALQTSGVWACVRLLAETVASLPLEAYRHTDTGLEVVKDHWFIKLLDSPNRYQTRTEFFETLMLNLALQGNCYCDITRVGGKVTSLLPILAAQMQTRLEPNGQIKHYYYQSADLIQEYAQDKVWHVKLMGNAIVGKSPLQYARNTMGITQAAEQQVSGVYKNGGKRSGILTIDSVLTDQQRAAIKENFNSLANGQDNRLLVLEAGMQFAPTSLSPQDIELLDSRRFQLSEICRIFGVPPVLISDNSGSTKLGSGIQQVVEGFYKLTLRPYLERFEASISRNLLGNADKGIVIKFNLDELLRADKLSRFETYQKAIQGGIMTPNECRLAEGLAPVVGGDALYAQVNLAPIELLGENLKAKTGVNAPENGENDPENSENDPEMGMEKPKKGMETSEKDDTEGE